MVKYVWWYLGFMNIGANADDKRTVSTKQPQVTDLRKSVDSWASSDIGGVLS